MTVPKRFDILRFLSALLKVFAWISLVIFILSAIGVAIFGGQVGQLLASAGGDNYSALVGGVGGVLSAIVILLIGLWYFVLLYAFGEGISLLLAMEENTRLSAALLLKMHQDAQTDPSPPDYPGGFTSEPEPYK